MSDTLIVRNLTVRPVNAPLAEPVRTASGDILTAPLVLLDLQTEEGVVGRSYLRCISQDVLEPLALLTAGMGAVLEGRRGRPGDLSEFLRSRYRLLGLGGLVGMAIGGIDMAAWDAAARSRDASLLHLLGAEPVPVDAYASFGMLDPATAAARSGAAVDLGYRGIKVKLGFPDVAQDEAVLRAIRGGNARHACVQPRLSGNQRPASRRNARAALARIPGHGEPRTARARAHRWRTVRLPRPAGHGA